MMYSGGSAMPLKFGASSRGGCRATKCNPPYPRTARSLGTRTNAGELELWNPQGGPAHPDFAPREPMSTMSSEFYTALIDAGADETKAREAAKSVARYDTDIAEIKASLLLPKWMVGFTLAFVVALAWRAFQ